MSRIAILGTGAVGGYYGGVLSQAGHEVHFIARSDFDTLKERGLQLDTDAGQLHLHPVQVHRRPDTVPACEIVLVTLKMTQLEALSSYLPRILERDGVVVALQNGLGVEEALRPLVPAARIWGAVCFLCAIRTAPGCVRQRDRNGIQVAPLEQGERSPLVEGLLASLRSLGVPASVEEDLAPLRWNKLLWNVPYNGLCALLRKSTSEIGGCAETRALVVDIMQEVRAACRAVTGREIPGERIEQLLAMTDSFDHYRPSMLIDVEAGRALELEAIYAEPMARAAAHDVPMPKTETLYRLLVAATTDGA